MADLERGERIKQLRHAAHLTQPVVADRSNVTLRAYQEWEVGGGIQWENAKRLAEVLDTTPDYIMSGRIDQPTIEPIPTQVDRIEQAIVEIRQDLDVQADAIRQIADALSRVEAAVQRARRREPPVGTERDPHRAA